MNKVEIKNLDTLVVEEAFLAPEERRHRPCFYRTDKEKIKFFRKKPILEDVLNPGSKKIPLDFVPSEKKIMEVVFTLASAGGA